MNFVFIRKYLFWPHLIFLLMVCFFFLGKIFENERDKEIMFFLGALVSASAAGLAILESLSANNLNQQLIKALRENTEELKKLKDVISSNCKTTNSSTPQLSLDGHPMLSSNCSTSSGKKD